MSVLQSRRSGWLGIIMLLTANAVLASPVTVNISAKTGTVEDTLVIFDPIDAKPAPGHDNAIIDQVDKRFVPRISVLRTGTSVTFPNSDRIRHQVYSFSAAKVFSLKLYAGSPSAAVVFDKPGLVVLGCNIHDKMSAFVAVVDSPYFSRLTASGTAELNLPAGRYRMRVWHPSLTSPIAVQEIAVQNAPLILPVTVNLDRSTVALSPWPE